MKKKIILLTAIGGLAISGTGQNIPTCNDFVVEKLEMLNDSTMKMIIRNNCANCVGSWGAYCDIRIIRNTTDTIANTKCLCLVGPWAGSATTYYLPSKVVTIPPLNQLKVSMPCVCDNILFSATIGINENQKKENRINISPNPANESIRIETTKGVIIKTINLHDINGKLIKSFLPTDTLLNIEDIAQGQYLLKIITDKGIYTEKVIKQ